MHPVTVVLDFVQLAVTCWRLIHQARELGLDPFRRRRCRSHQRGAPNRRSHAFLNCLGGSLSGSQDHTPRQAGVPNSPAPIQCALRLCVPATAQHHQLNTRRSAGRRCLIRDRRPLQPGPTLPADEKENHPCRCRSGCLGCCGWHSRLLSNANCRQIAPDRAGTSGTPTVAALANRRRRSVHAGWEVRGGPPAWSGRLPGPRGHPRR